MNDRFQWVSDQDVEWHEEATVERHYGPGTHPGTGTEQTVHGGGGAEKKYPSHWMENTPPEIIGGLNEWTDRLSEWWKDAMGYHPEVWEFTNDAVYFQIESLSQRRAATPANLQYSYEMADMMERTAMGAVDLANRRIWVQDARPPGPVVGTPRWIQGVLHEMGHLASDLVAERAVGRPLPMRVYMALNAMNYRDRDMVKEYAADLLAAHVYRKAGQSEAYEFWRADLGKFRREDYKNLNAILRELNQPTVKPSERSLSDTVLVVYPKAGEAVIWPRTDEKEPYIVRHYGPGPHPGTGTEQVVHGGGGGQEKAYPSGFAEKFGDKLAALEQYAVEGVKEWADDLSGDIKIYPRGVGDSLFGKMDYWILSNGDAVEVTSHDATGEKFVRLAYRKGLLPPGTDPRNLSGEATLLALGQVRFSTSGARGVMVGQRKLTDEQVETLSRMVEGDPESILWETVKPYVLDMGPESGGLTVGWSHGEASVGLAGLMAVRHYGPGAHPGTGTEQTVHAGAGGERKESGPKYRVVKQKGKFRPWHVVNVGDGHTAVSYNTEEEANKKAASLNEAARQAAERIAEVVGKQKKATLEGFHTFIEHRESPEFIFAQRGEGFYIGLDRPFNPGMGRLHRVRVMLRPNEIIDPEGLLAEIGTDVEASRAAWKSVPRDSSHEDWHTHKHWKDLGFRAQVGWVEPGLPHLGRELVVWNRDDVEDLGEVVQRASGPLRRLHYGPGAHPGTGTEQAVHAGDNRASDRKVYAHASAAERIFGQRVGEVAQVANTMLATGKPPENLQPGKNWPVFQRYITSLRENIVAIYSREQVERFPESLASLGGDYFILRDGTLVAVQSHDDVGQAMARLLATSSEGYLPSHVVHPFAEPDVLPQILGAARWSNNGPGAIGLSWADGVTLTDEQAETIGYLARANRVVNSLTWSTFDLDVNEARENIRLTGRREGVKAGLADVLMQRHYGPGPHPGTGTEQQVHGGGGGREARRLERKAPLGMLPPAVGPDQAAKMKIWWLSPEGDFFDAKPTHDDSAGLWLGGKGVIADIAKESGAKPGTGLERVYPGDILLQAFGWVRGGVERQPYNTSTMFVDAYHYTNRPQQVALQSLYGLLKPTSIVAEDTGAGKAGQSPRRADLENILGEDFEFIGKAVVIRGALRRRHYGPGAHPGTGTEQQVHAGDGGDRQERPAARLDRQLLDRPGLSPFGPADQERAEQLLAENFTERAGDDFLDYRNEVYVAPSGKAYDVNAAIGEGTQAFREAWLVGHEGVGTEIFNRLAVEKAGERTLDPNVGKTDWKELAVPENSSMVRHWVSEVMLEGGGRQKATLFELEEPMEDNPDDDLGSGRFEAVLSWNSKLRFFDTREDADAWIREQAIWKDHTPWPWTDAGGEDLMLGLGFLRVSRGGSSGPSAGLSWNGDAGLTDAQIRKAAALARDAIESGGNVVWESRYGPNANNGVTEEWPDRDFTAALRGEPRAVARSYWDLPVWARALLVPRRGPLRRRHLLDRLHEA